METHYSFKIVKENPKVNMDAVTVGRVYTAKQSSTGYTTFIDDSGSIRAIAPFKTKRVMECRFLVNLVKVSIFICVGLYCYKYVIFN